MNKTVWTVFRPSNSRPKQTESRLKLWQETCQTNRSIATTTKRSTEDVAMNSATDREPMDSAVRVTVPTQRRNGLPTPASDIEKRTADEDSENSHRAAKRRRKKIGDRANQMVVVYDVTPPQAETELYTRLHKMDTHRTLTQQFRCARHILTGLGHCAADLVSCHLHFTWNSPHCTFVFDSCGPKFSKTKVSPKLWAKARFQPP